VRNVTFSLETSPNKTLREKCGGTWHIISPPSNKVGGVPHLIAPMSITDASFCSCWPVQFLLYSVLCTLSELHEWSARGAQLGLLASSFAVNAALVGDNGMEPRLNYFLEHAPQRRARGWTGRKYRFSSLLYFQAPFSLLTGVCMNKTIETWRVIQ